MDISRLNPSQQAAVTYDGSALLVLAGAGTGKTETLTSRIAYMIKERGINPSRIVAMTFTNKAATEMKNRASRMTGLAPSELNIGTFHSICSMILRIFHKDVGVERDFCVLDMKDSFNIMRSVCKKVLHDDTSATVNKCKSVIDAWKNEGLAWNDVGTSVEARANTNVETRRETMEIIDVYREYTKTCREDNGIDFGDLLVLVVKALQTNPAFKEQCLARWRHILVDEFQDTNVVQMLLVKQLAPPTSDKHTVTVVGDDYQCIHEWRGATVDNILKFEKHYPDAHVVCLNVNYRCSPVIVRASSAVIRNNDKQRHKELVAHSTCDTPIDILLYKKEDDECKGVVELIKKAGKDTYGDTVILYRTNAMSRSFEIALGRAHIPFEVKGACSFFDRAEVKDALAYMRIVTMETPKDADLLRIINMPPRRIGKPTVDKLKKHAEENGGTLFDTLSSLKGSGTGIKSFKDMVDELRVLKPESLCEYFRVVMEKTGYVAYLKKAGDSETNMQRIANVAELSKSIKEYEGTEDAPTITDFLNKIALFQSEYDENTGNKKNAVQLMTLHSAKGLEFDRVFMVSVCDGVLPHGLAVKEGSIDAERRLCYVGMTRAKTRLTMSWPSERIVWGRTDNCRPSVFLEEVPKSCVVMRKGGTN